MKYEDDGPKSLRTTNSAKWIFLIYIPVSIHELFHISDVIRLWDSLFADEKRFDFLIQVACAMLM